MATPVSLLSSCESRLSKLSAKQASLTEFNRTQSDILRLLLVNVELSHRKELLLDESTTMHGGGGDGDVCEQLEEYLQRRPGFCAEENRMAFYRAVYARCTQVDLTLTLT